MSPRPTQFSAFVALIAMSAGFALAEDKPPPPDVRVPDLVGSKAIPLSLDRDAPFDTETHEKILKDLVTNTYVAQLRKALFVQDKVHQFESKAHFDNCDFDGSVAYINALFEDADKHVLAASKLEVPAPTVKSEIEEVFYVLGQAMHAVQDFYAHSNYVELKTPHVSRVTDLEIVLLWREAGRAQLTKLQQEGLVSGYVFWGFPQKCKSGTPSHADLAKDSALTTSGRKKVSHLQNTNLYEIAVFLARESSIQMLQDAFKRWPILKEANGNDIAFEVLIDRRGL